MSWPCLVFLGYGQLLMLDDSLTVLLVLVEIVEIALCVIVLSEINDG